MTYDIYVKTSRNLYRLQRNNKLRVIYIDSNLETGATQANQGQFKDSIVNSTVTSVNLSVIHIASEIILLILIISSHKKLSGLIHKISTYLVRNKKTILKPHSVTSV